MRAPELTGPVTGGRGWPFGSPTADPAVHGYVEEEFFLEGVATRYRPADGSEFGADGVWDSVPAGTAPYRTRIVVYRPADPERFSGTVIVFWNNVSAGFDIYDGADRPRLYESGDAFIAVTAQRVGVHGAPSNPVGLVTWDPERYGDLSLPSDDYSYDVVAQVAQAVRGERTEGSADPLAGYPVRRVIAQGSSQSAGRLATFINAVHRHTPVFDGYLLTVYMGFGMPIEVGDEVIDLGGPEKNPGPALVAANHLREIDAKVMVVNSELEARVGAPFRQPDTDSYRCWEVAGTCHTSVQAGAARAPRLARDFGGAIGGLLAQGAGSELPPGVTPNRLPLTTVIDAATDALIAWVDGGPAPAIAPRIEIEDGAIARDVFGIARGGIRLPEVEAPLAVNGSEPLGEHLLAILQGSCVPIDAERLRAVHGDLETYLDRFRAASRAAVHRGYLRRDDAREGLAEANSQASAVLG